MGNIQGSTPQQAYLNGGVGWQKSTEETFVLIVIVNTEMTLEMM